MAEPERTDDEAEERRPGGLPPLHDAITELSSAALEHAAARAMTITSLRLDLPVELRLDVDERGRVRLRAAPPTQLTETTFMPVRHRLRVRVVEGDGADD